jgi:tetratricopeptide (TPR) repeat protein
MPRITVLAPVLAGLVLAAGTGAAAQDWKGTGRLEGRVTDAEGKPIANAAVKLDLSARSGGPAVKTDKNGKWAYLGLVAGEWKVDVSADGYAARQVKVSMPSEGARVPPVEVKLDKTAPKAPPPEVLQALSRAEDAYKAERYEVAIAEYEKLLALRPDLAATIHQQIGFANIRLRRYEPALTHLQKTLDADPGNVQIRAIAAQAALAGGMLARGLELLKGIDEASIKSPDLFFDIGVAFLNASHPEPAIVYFTKAITVDPRYADGYFRRALAYIQANRIAEARADLATVLTLTPDGPQADAARKTLDDLREPAPGPRPPDGR